MVKFFAGLFVGLAFLAGADSAFAAGKCPDQPGAACEGLRCGIENCRCQRNPDTKLAECVDNVA